tara:strand:+ start:6723 stop:6845 length:123 start_codon:yes stop_codon:yes gene_type:complete
MKNKYVLSSLLVISVVGSFLFFKYAVQEARFISKNKKFEE